MKIYVGIDMVKDKFDYCAMDDALNILCRGNNRENSNERFKELSVYWILSDSDSMRMGEHLYGGRVKGVGVFNVSPVHEVKIW